MTRMMSFWGGILAAASIAFLAAPAATQERSITVASTTSTQDSGLFDHILPMFEKKAGINVRVVAQGTGQALDTGRRGDVDVVFVHSRDAEEAFVAAGYGVERHEVMYNDFVIIGPSDDPAGIRGMTNAVEALAKIAEAEATFVSRGDDSGTHKAEQKLWKVAGVEPSGEWYRDVGSGMGATLNIASQIPGYTLADRGTWISFDNKGLLKVAVEGDQSLFNQYGVILVNPEKHPHVKAEEGQAFVDWLISDEGQAAIASYKRDGQQLFFPNAKDGSS